MVSQSQAQTVPCRPQIRGLRMVGTGIDHVLEPGRVAYIIGSGPDADLRLCDPRVSRLHCALVWLEHGELLVVDRSRNGTWIDKVRCERGYLHDGARLRVGGTVLTAYTQVSRGLVDDLARAFRSARPQPRRSSVAIQPRRLDRWLGRWRW